MTSDISPNQLTNWLIDHRIFHILEDQYIHDTALCKACEIGNYRVAKHLICDYGFCPSTSCGAKLKPLHIAIIHGHFKIVLLLLDKGANANAEDDNHDRPLHLALDGANQRIIEDLMKYGAKPYLRGQYNETAIEKAEMLGLKKIAEILRKERA